MLHTPPQTLPSGDSDSDSESESPASSVAATLGQSSERPMWDACSTGADDDGDDIICAISEYRPSSSGHRQIGIAFVNKTRAEAELSYVLEEFSYAYTMTRIAHYQPKAVLVLETAASVTSARSSLGSYAATPELVAKCEERKYPIVQLPRRYWLPYEAIRLLETYAFRNEVQNVLDDLDDWFAARIAFCAAMTFALEDPCWGIADHCLAIRFIPPEDIMLLDYDTIASLELFQNVRKMPTQGKTTLFSVINETLTPQGRRLLRKSMLQPSRNKACLTARWEAVNELHTNKELFGNVRRELRELKGIEFEKMVLCNTNRPRQAPLAYGPSNGRPAPQDVARAEQELKRILVLKKFLTQVRELRKVLVSVESARLRTLGAEFDERVTGNILNDINQVLDSAAVYSTSPLDMRNNRLHAVKAGTNAVLDEHRASYRLELDLMYQYAETVNGQYNVAAEVRYDQRRGFYFRVPMSQLSNNRPFAAQLLHGTRKGAYFEARTSRLISHNVAIQRRADLVMMQSDTVVVELATALRRHASVLFRMNYAIAELDMFASFARSASLHDYVMPELDEVLLIKNARHPIMGQKRRIFVTNDVHLNDTYRRFHVITGSNMSGKSTYIRMVALIQIMAQIGCFAPCSFVCLPLFDRIFTRLSTEDNLEKNLSTLGVELQQMNLALREATPQSLLIVDELGRGTSTKDGLSIALAIAEKLLQKDCRVLFVTHYPEIGRVLQQHVGVYNHHLTSDKTSQRESSQAGPDDTQVSMLHKVSPGIVKDKDYGVEWARSMNFPPKMMEHVESIKNEL
ncbi:muts domain V-domain-containing protein, partial [Diplogelasinospora grovesii]